MSPHRMSFQTVGLPNLIKGNIQIPMMRKIRSHPGSARTGSRLRPGSRLEKDVVSSFGDNEASTGVVASSFRSHAE